MEPAEPKTGQETQARPVRKTRVRREQLTNEHIDGIRFKPCQKLPFEVDALKVHIDSAENIKTIGGHDFLGVRWQIGLLDPWWWERSARERLYRKGLIRQGSAIGLWENM